MTWFHLSRRRNPALVALACVLGLLVAAAAWWPTGSPGRTLTAYFSSAVAVFPGNDVQILGVPVGTVRAVHPQGPVVAVLLEIDHAVHVPADAAAVLVAPSLVAGRSVQLTPAYTGGPTMADGAVIPLARTAVPLGIDDLVRTVDELATTLGPQGVNREGALAELLDVGAANLGGNGQAMHDTLGELARLSATLAGSRQDLVGTITELQSFVSTLAVHDAQVRRLSTQLADVTTFLAAERGDLGAALRQLSVTLGDVAAFVRDHRAVLKSNVNQLSTLTAVLVAQRVALAEILDVAPTGLGNVANAYHAAHGTLDARANIEELRGAAEALGALRADAPPPLPPLPLLAVPTVPGGR